MVNKRAFTIIVILVGLIPMYFNSCQSTHYYIGEGSSFLSSKSCSIAPYFDREYRPFLRQNCSTCHAANGRGKGAFADSNFEIAFQDFMNTGFEKVGKFAVNPSHNAPYSSPSHTEKINRIENGMQKAILEESSCGTEFVSNIDTTTWIKTRSQGINANASLNNDFTGEATTIEWDLGKDLILPENEDTEVPDLTGIKVTVQARIRRLQNKLFYEVFQPTVDLTDFQPVETPKTDANADNNAKLLGVRIQGVRITVNGDFVLNESTFTFIDEVVKFDENNEYIDINNQTVLSSGTMIALTNVTASDVMSIAFDKISFVETDPPPPPVYVSFANSDNINVDEENSDNTKRQIPITVRLSGPAIQRVTVTLEADSSVNNPATPLYDGRYDNINGTDLVGINNFDWDFKFDENRVEFSPSDLDSDGNPVLQKTVYITLASDRRNESSESIQLNITEELVSGARVANSNISKNISINASDSDQPLFVPGSPDNNLGMYQTLFDMNDGFRDSCLHCHNNIETNKYDLTDYDSMLANNVLGSRIPGDAESSDMYRRLLPQGEYDDLLKMPADNGLENDFVRTLIRSWLDNGGLNN